MGTMVTVCDAAGYLASGLVLAAFCMKEMIPLRLVALMSNVAFLVYGIGLGLGPVWVLHAVLLPVNGWRLGELLHARARCRAQTIIEPTAGPMGRPTTSTLPPAAAIARRPRAAPVL
jgi:CRP/FNR family transcriptional regulator, cyclic AMP receptor protein